jgi:bacterioferritin
VQNETALEVSTGAALPLNPSRQDIIKELNNSLATELVCMLRYKRHRFIADGLGIPTSAELEIDRDQRRQSLRDRGGQRAQ